MTGGVDLAADAIARILTDPLSHDLGQQIVIETVGGAGGMIGSARVARAAPDGYTILLHQVGLAAGMTLYPNPSFDAEKDLTGIGVVNTSASTITARKTLPANSTAHRADPARRRARRLSVRGTVSSAPRSRDSS